MSSLRRTMAAGYTLPQAVTLEQAAEGGEALLLPLDSLFLDIPAYTIPTQRQEARCRNGNPLPAAGLCFGDLLVPRLPGEEHDRSVALVVTEEETVFCLPQGRCPGKDGAL